MVFIPKNNSEGQENLRSCERLINLFSVNSGLPCGQYYLCLCKLMSTEVKIFKPLQIKPPLTLGLTRDSCEIAVSFK